MITNLRNQLPWRSPNSTVLVAGYVFAVSAIIATVFTSFSLSTNLAISFICP